MPYERPTFPITYTDESACVFQAHNCLFGLHQEKGGGKLKGKESTDGHLYFAEHPYG